MNKLVSKNPVLRFKLGKKIVKAYGGVKTSRRTPGGLIIYDNNSSEPGFFSRFWNYLTSPLLSRVGMNGKPIVDTVAKQNTVSTPKDYSFMTKGTLNSESELSKKQREDYFNKLKLKYNFVSTPSKKLNVISTNNVWLKGYKHNEVKDVRAMLNELIKLGLLNDKFGADGKWGDNTEKAYKLYLALKNVPTYKKPEMSSVAEMAGIYSEENKPLYQQIRFKQGGQLVSRNPIKRFKNKK